MHDKMTVARFWSKVEVTKNALDCWPWRGAVRGGYGNIKVSGVNQNANRIAWEIFNGRSIAPKMALHHCDNKLCCNPRHIYAGTRKQNAEDARVSKYAALGVSKVKRDKGQRLSPSDIQYIIAQRKKGRKVARIAEQFGLPYSTVHSAIARNTE